VVNRAAALAVEPVQVAQARVVEPVRVLAEAALQEVQARAGELLACSAPRAEVAAVPL
jgi:hypothetical protein